MNHLVRSSEGVLSGVLVIIGIIYISFGWSWIAHPLASMSEVVDILGIDLTVTDFGWWWIVGGAITSVCGLLSRFRWANTLGVVVGMGTSLFISGPFIVEAIQDPYSLGLITTLAYSGWAVIIGWVSVKTSLNEIKGRDSDPSLGEVRGDHE